MDKPEKCQNLYGVRAEWEFNPRIINLIVVYSLHGFHNGRGRPSIFHLSLFKNTEKSNKQLKVLQKRHTKILIKKYNMYKKIK